MTDIDVPDWVVDQFATILFDTQGLDWPEDFPECADNVRAQIRAALSAWVVPEKFQVRTRCPFFGWGHWYSIKSQKERDDHFNRMNMGDWIAERRDLYKLRQEKPE